MDDRLHCFTLKFAGRALVLQTPLSIAVPSKDHASQPKFGTRCIWDTGASCTVITQEVVDALGLKPSGFMDVNTASERNKRTYTYQIDLFLSADLVFENITVSLGVITEGIGCLLGMDIIGVGDLSVTNLKGNTCMSFRYPSSHEIDFLKNSHFGIEKPKPVLAPPKMNRNDPCFCGSGKQYKRCHGK